MIIEHFITNNHIERNIKKRNEIEKEAKCSEVKFVKKINIKYEKYKTKISIFYYLHSF